MKGWRDDRFGLFIHWGLFSILGGYWNGKYYSYAAEWIKASANISNNDYEQLIHKFNPVHFNAADWAKMAKQLGVRYVTMVPKHHEGFCMWDSKYTNYDLNSTPYKGDILGSLAKALQKEGIDFNLYYSILDWENPNYRSEIKSPADLAAMERYVQYMKNQLAELLHKYPSIKGFWFDGEWEKSWTSHPEFGAEISDYLKKLRPNIIINNRLRVLPSGKTNHNADGTPTGDYDSSYERRLPKADVPFDWEACMTIPENQWGYAKTWNGHIKTPAEILDMLVQCTSLGGNFMLNFGPKPDGTFRKEEWNMVNAIGPWMHTHGQAIYGCGYPGLAKPAWGRITEKMDHKLGSRTLFLWIPRSYLGASIDLAVDPASIQSASLLGRHPVSESFTSVDSSEAQFKLPAHRDPLADVIEVHLK